MKTLECSSKGDKRFCSFYAFVDFDGKYKSIEKEIIKAMSDEDFMLDDEEDLYDVVSAMEGDLEQFNKSIWFIKAMLK